MTVALVQRRIRAETIEIAFAVDVGDFRPPAPLQNHGQRRVVLSAESPFPRDKIAYFAHCDCLENVTYFHYAFGLMAQLRTLSFCATCLLAIPAAAKDTQQAVRLLRDGLGAYEHGDLRVALESIDKSIQLERSASAYAA